MINIQSGNDYFLYVAANGKKNIPTVFFSMQLLYVSINQEIRGSALQHLFSSYAFLQIYGYNRVF